MAYSQRGQGNYGRSGYSNGYSSGYTRQAPVEKPQFNLDQYIDDMVDVYQIFKSKLDAANIELPPDTIARWVTSAKISMDK